VQDDATSGQAAAAMPGAPARMLTTASMAKRYGLSDSTADQFTLYNIALLATFTLCGIR
jgi:hypothetical protein